MKRLLIILILTISLQSFTTADDIRDFEIEGMSIGNSLLDFMSKNLIINEINNKDISFYYDDDFVAISTWEIRDRFKIYDDVGVILKLNDDQFEIYALEGTLYMDGKSKIEECYKKQNEITKEIQNSLSSTSKKDTWFVSKKNLKKHQLSVKYNDFDLPGGGIVRITCYEIKKGVKKYSDTNLLYVVINSAEFIKYLSN
tara:strand:+ start:283 stop:879 length:597 start_codon:yes stop_codon:yes gene_type:complete